ncbi:DUF1826 domain-containing protein [Colwellia sp. UCD-KL20]|uniref:DUF1826 domain-containing protein n=1 Tax=Colwellia sp. UCD-KL20 TaxID=1917165 RepID=UPI0009FAF691|nr:DUF1826 domain-containing protein [Colwellia sp. UCD-KL20]
MNALAELNENTLTQSELKPAPATLIKRASKSNTVEAFTDIYKEDVNIAIWQRSLSDKLALAVEEILASGTQLKMAEAVTVDSVHKKLINVCGDSSAVLTLIDDIALLVDMFSCLFDLKEVGLRLTTLDSPMCPRFHFDRIPCRLVTTYHGIATQWLPHEVVDRSKLGAGNLGKPDEESGLFTSVDDIRELAEGDVALLKGEFWHANEGAGLVHRSPPQGSEANAKRRLLLTLDFIND